MPQLMPLYWCFSIFILLYIFVMMISFSNDIVLVEEFNNYNEKLSFSLCGWEW